MRWPTGCAAAASSRASSTGRVDRIVVLPRRQSLSMESHKEIDTRGLNYPLPILKGQKALADMHAAEGLKVLASDPGPMRDCQAFARQTGNELLEQTTQG